MISDDCVGTRRTSRSARRRRMRWQRWRWWQRQRVMARLTVADLKTADTTHQTPRHQAAIVFGQRKKIVVPVVVLVPCWSTFDSNDCDRLGKRSSKKCDLVWRTFCLVKTHPVRGLVVVSSFACLHQICILSPSFARLCSTDDGHMLVRTFTFYFYDYLLEMCRSNSLTRTRRLIWLRNFVKLN